MKKIRLLRIICVILLALILLFTSLDILLPRRGDEEGGRLAVCFIHEGRLFPQMDYRQMFSHLDIASYYVVDDSMTKEEMLERIEHARKGRTSDEVVLVCEGDFAISGLTIAISQDYVSDLILLSPELDVVADLGAIGTHSPDCRVAIFAESGKVADTLYERLSGEDTKFTPGRKVDSSAPELYLSADATRYYARSEKYKDPQVASVITLNSPIMQTYLSNYLLNHTIGKKDISRVPLWTWVIKTVCTVITMIAFFLYAATLPSGKKYDPSANRKHAQKENADGTRVPSGEGADGNGERRHHRDASGRIRGRSIAEKYKSTINHLLALQLLMGVLFTIPALIFLWRKDSSFLTVLLIWICISFLSSAFFLSAYIRKIKERKVRGNRAMWPIHAAFTALLTLDIFMLTLLWKGTGFLTLHLLLFVAIVLSVLLGVSVAMLQLADAFYEQVGGKGQSVLDSVKFSAIRFVPMVIVFTFSIIMGRGLAAVQVVLLAVSLLGASCLRRVIRKGAWGEVLSVIMYACLYWMMF